MALFSLALLGTPTSLHYGTSSSSCLTLSLIPPPPPSSLLFPSFLPDTHHGTLPPPSPLALSHHGTLPSPPGTLNMTCMPSVTTMAPWMEVTTLPSAVLPLITRLGIDSTITRFTNIAPSRRLPRTYCFTRPPMLPRTSTVWCDGCVPGRAHRCRCSKLSDKGSTSIRT